MAWGNVYAGQFGSDSDLARELAAAAQIYAVAKKKKPKHSPPSKAYPESPYQFVGPPEGYGLEMGSPYDPSPNQAVPEALAYAKMVGEAETKAKAAEVSVSPVTQKVLQARRASVRADRDKTLSGLAASSGMGINNQATLPPEWYDKSLGGDSGMPQPGPVGESYGKSPWQKFFTTLGDLFSGTGDENYASYEKMMGGR